MYLKPGYSSVYLVHVASFNGSDRLKHFPYHRVQRIVIKWSTVFAFFILNLNGYRCCEAQTC